jgi:hypothetical protein
VGASKALIAVAVMWLAAHGAVAQQMFWSDVPEPADRSNMDRRIVPAQYRTVAVDVSALASALDAVDAAGEGSLMIPDAEGGAERFRIRRSTVMHPDLQAEFPMIRAYMGESVDRPGVLGRFDLTPHGFHAMLLDPYASDLFIDPYAFGQNELHIVYRKEHFSKQLPPDHVFCSYEEVNDLEAEHMRSMEWMQTMGDHRAGDCQKRTYRLALACTGEYANYHGSNTSNNNKSFAMAAMVTTMNRVNGIYERDAAITMVMVPNNQNLIYLNPSTDPYTNNNGSTMLGQNQSTCNSVIGSGNYDIGHVFSTGGGGVAYLNSPCTSNKARGVTGSPAPVGDPFDIDYVAHEMGHQFGANHTQYNNCNREGNAAFEPGSASTIMGYAGICSPNVQSNSDALFLGYSLQEIAANVVSGASSTCAVVTSSGNSAPTVAALTNRTIPKSTPFVLTAVATDANGGDQLTYAWEQMDNQLNGSSLYPQPPQASNTGGPNFRALLPSTSPSRWFPNLAAVVANTTPTWEVLPSVARTLHFRVTVRDNHAGAGCTAERNMTVTVNSGSGPFEVTQPNTNVSWQAGSQQTVTWHVANTNAPPVNCSAVDILLSVDGGFTYPYVLASATPNDGTQLVTLPVIPATNTARVMVRASANIFYDISNTNFTVTAAPAQPSLRAKVYLDGAYDAVAGMMWDSLRVGGLLPLVEPYTALGFPSAGGSGGESTTPSVLAVAGPNAIVDWVRVELRSQASPGTVVAARHGLLQRDGDIVATDGTSALQFNTPAGQYHVAVRHRNHLGCMTASALTFGGSPVDLDLRTAATATYGTEARKTIGPVRALWAGNVVADDRIRYTNQNNDRDPILQAVGGVVPTNATIAYGQADVNMDGSIRYTGARNDRDIILQNVGGVVPTNVRTEQLP